MTGRASSPPCPCPCPHPGQPLTPSPALPNLAEPEPRTGGSPNSPRPLPKPTTPAGRCPHHLSMGHPLCAHPCVPPAQPIPTIPITCARCGGQGTGDARGGKGAGAASPSVLPSLLSRFSRKWRWGEKREREREDWGMGKRKSWTYLGEFCAHEDEEAEGQQLACRSHSLAAPL